MSEIESDIFVIPAVVNDDDKEMQVNKDDKEMHFKVDNVDNNTENIIEQKVTLSSNKEEEDDDVILVSYYSPQANISKGLTCKQIPENVNITPQSNITEGLTCEKMSEQTSENIKICPQSNVKKGLTIEKISDNINISSQKGLTIEKISENVNINPQSNIIKGLTIEKISDNINISSQSNITKGLTIEKISENVNICPQSNITKGLTIEKISDNFNITPQSNITKGLTIEKISENVNISSQSNISKGLTIEKISEEISENLNIPTEVKINELSLKRVTKRGRKRKTSENHPAKLFPAWKKFVQTENNARKRYVERGRKRKRLESQTDDPLWKVQSVKLSRKEEVKRGRKRKPRLQDNRAEKVDNFRMEVIQSVLQPNYKSPDIICEKLVKQMMNRGQSISLTEGDPRLWSQSQVAAFVNSIIPGGASIFNDQEIDGQSFLLMTQKDLREILGLKLGPALKIFNCIISLRQQVKNL